MGKTAIIYASVHHENTKKIVEAIAEKYDIELIDATKTKKMNLSGYSLVGFASGIYYSKLHQAVIDFAKNNLTANKKIFMLYTSGSNRDYRKNFLKEIEDKKPVVIGTYKCPGFDTYGPFKFIGGVSKGRPNENDINCALKFFDELEK